MSTINIKDNVVPDKMKDIDVKEFREKGYLQELNRQFLHPLGMALYTSIDDKGKESFGGVFDARNDSEGFVFSDMDVEKTRAVEKEQIEKRKSRIKELGYFIQPEKGE